MDVAAQELWVILHMNSNAWGELLEGRVVRGTSCWTLYCRARGFQGTRVKAGDDDVSTAKVGGDEEVCSSATFALGWSVGVVMFYLSVGGNVREDGPRALTIDCSDFCLQI
jgi:hypothetical protein